MEPSVLETAAILWVAGRGTLDIAVALVKMKLLKGMNGREAEAWVYNRLNKIKTIAVKNTAGEAVKISIIVGESR